MGKRQGAKRNERERRYQRERGSSPEKKVRKMRDQSGKKRCKCEIAEKRKREERPKRKDREEG